MLTHVWLDLDNTLISSLKSNELSNCIFDESKGLKITDSDYTVFARPGLQEFLDYIFSNYAVSVWTAASKSYAAFIIDNFILIPEKPDRKLRYVLFRYHCKKCNKRTRGKCPKLLSTLKPLFDISSIRSIIVDDHPDVYGGQPEKCINVSAFKADDAQFKDDDELRINVIPTLKRICASS